MIHSCKHIILILIAFGLCELVNAQNDSLLKSLEKSILFEQYDHAHTIIEQLRTEDLNPSAKLLLLSAQLKTNALDDTQYNIDFILEVGDAIIEKNAQLDTIARLKYWQSKAEYFREIKKLKEALALHEKVFEEVKILGNQELIGFSMLYIAATQEGLSENDSAKANMLNAIQVFETSLTEDDPRWSNIYNIAGAIYYKFNNLETSNDYYEKCIAKAESTLGINSSIAAMAYNNMANNYQLVGDFESAIKYTQIAERINRKRNNNLSLSFSLYNAAINYFYLGDYGRSRDYLEECIAIRENIYDADHIDIAKPVNIVAIIESIGGKYDVSIPKFYAVTEVFKATYGENHFRVAPCYENLAIAYKNLNQLDSALYFMEAAEEIFNIKGMPDRRPTADFHYNFANILVKKNRKQDALKRLEESNRILNKIGLFNSEYGAGNLNTLARIYEADQPDKANAAYKEAFAKVQLSNNEITKYKNTRNSFITINNYIGFLYDRYVATKDKNYLDTLEFFIQDFDDLMAFYTKQSNDPYTKQTIAEQSNEFYMAQNSIYYSLYAENGEEKVAERLFNISENTKATILNDLVSDYKIKSFSNLPAELLSEEDSLREVITNLSYELYELDNVDSVKRLLFQAKESFNNHVNNYAKNHPEYHELKFQNETINFEKIRHNLLDEETSLVEYFTDDTAYYAIVINKHNHFVAYLGNKTNINSTIETYYDELTHMQSLSKPNEELYNFLWQPIAEKVQSKVILIPVEKIHYLNFEALQHNGKYLIEKIDFSYAISAKVLLHQQERDAVDKSFVFVAPGFEDDLKSNYSKALPESEVEDHYFLRTLRQPWSMKLGKRLKQKIKVDGVYSGEATETNIKEKVHEAKLIHFATHAVSDENDPLRSKLILAKDIGEQVNDGYLHAYELYSLSLQTELAILSACESGIGNLQTGEGMLSLAYSLNYSGCPSVIMSLWKIDEKTNAEILESFYKHVRKSSTKSEALRKAKLEYIQNNTNLHPFYWAGLVVMGNNNKIELKQNDSRRNVVIGLITIIALSMLIFLKRIPSS